MVVITDSIVCYHHGDIVVFIIISNATVLVFKLIAYMFTGSATMLSEAIHSLADLLNQVFKEY